MEPEGKERRLKPRFNASLPCTLTLPEGDILFPGASLRCRTRDLSETGVGLVAPSIYLGYACVVDEGRQLRLELELPGVHVRMLVTAAHYVRLGRAGEEATYLIGLRIAELEGDSRAPFSNYLESLGRSDAA